VIKKGQSLLVVATRDDVRILDLETRQELARFDGEHAVLQVEGALGPGTVAMFRHAKKEPGVV
jgi:hypothetical protein